MSSLLAARYQMALSLIFHIVFAAIGIGMPALMVVAERRYLTTGQAHYLRLTRKWAKAVGLLFAIGAISGTALAFEIGLLWPRYMQVVGGVVGHLFGLEGFAFFIEAIFIGLYLYGWDRLSPRAHWRCGVVIAVAGATSGILILGVNSWMQQPVGFQMSGDRIVMADALAVFKRYGWFVMSLHSTLSCYMAVSFAVAGIYAYGYLHGKRNDYHTSAIRICMTFGGICALLQPISGDLLAKFVFHTQTGKFAAMEGQFETQRRAPLRLGGLPDVAEGKTKYAIEIPGGLSFLATHDFNAEVKGLNSLPREDWPDVPLTHLSFQIMVIFGLILIALSLWFWLSYWRKRSGAMNSPFMLWALVGCAPLGFLALEAGWMVTEIGRQPWAIQPNAEIGFAGMRIADAVTTVSGVKPVFFAFTILYIVLAFIVVMLLRGLADSTQQNPDPPSSAATETQTRPV